MASLITNPCIRLSPYCPLSKDFLPPNILLHTSNLIVLYQQFLGADGFIVLTWVERIERETVEIERGGENRRPFSTGRYNKCNEEYPACYKCQKSKHKYLGYNTLFKVQPGPIAIRLVPSIVPSQGYLVAIANPYGNQSQMLGPANSIPIMGYDPALSAGISSPGQATQKLKYTSAIDPVLESTIV
ncbi:uncharacterized protein K444DRAFT_627194 [Hyaloscypha bicolor E]|uniref:Uncharacterized protein n=1 Tax=Hyaloscypha bicolor E TaxID=1095630 RepID=A0A2J6TGT9_9HELO|nr:uncharacterized protein K444DRAFT_627194 [Hyaloscypha bicolor E]PMD62230.1 hypothetical protein K444DRAFT_627194 [Hyaloscypha bicolor E]